MIQCDLYMNLESLDSVIRNPQTSTQLLTHLRGVVPQRCCLESLMLPMQEYTEAIRFLLSVMHRPEDVPTEARSIVSKLRL